LLILIRLIAALDNRWHSSASALDRVPRKVLVIPVLVVLLFDSLPPTPLLELALRFNVPEVFAWLQRMWAVWFVGIALAYVVLVPQVLWILVRDPLCRTTRNMFALATPIIYLTWVAWFAFWRSDA